MPGRYAPRRIEGAPSHLILFDGVCVFCSRWVNFVIARDRNAVFRFMPIQSDAGTALARRLGINPDNPETNAAVLDGIAYQKSDAALMVLSQLPRWWWVRLGWLCPKPIRDFVYDRIASVRYRIFDRTETCMVPNAAIRARFLDRL